MIELPEAITLARQVEETLQNCVVTRVYGPTHLHRFTFFNAPPDHYAALLEGRRLIDAVGKGIFVDLHFDNDTYLSISDGIIMRHGSEGEPIPPRYQLLITFDNNSFVSFNTAMYGSINAFCHTMENKYRTLSLESISPLTEQYTETTFDRLFAEAPKRLSAKALLATEQRIPGVGNGVLQDILFNAHIHPKRKALSLDSHERLRLFQSLKTTLRAMTDGGGRDTETDFLGRRGSYSTLLSKNTYDRPCPRCGSAIIKDAYLGGSVYYCPHCQPL